MIGFIINNEYLDLYPNTVLELETNNAFLQFTEEVKGNFSLPFELPPTDKNIRLTRFVSKIQTKSPAFIECICMRNGFQHSTGKLRIEQVNHHLSQIEKGKINVYYLFGVSDFYQDIKDKKLRSINMGGNRVFTFSGNANDFYTTGSFWTYMHQVLRGSIQENFAIYPVRNDSFWSGQTHPLIMNECFIENDGQLYLEKIPNHSSNQAKLANTLVPFPYLHSVLQAISAFIGWKFEGDILNDADFRKITLPNTLAIAWAFPIPPPINALIPLGRIEFDIAKNLPDVKISEFLIAIKNRMGWWYDFDFRTKTIKIRTLTSAAIGATKDVTEYAAPAIPQKIAQEPKAYAIRNSASGNSKPDFKNVNKKSSVNTFANLPAPTDAQYKDVRLVKADNNFYICAGPENGSTTDLAWRFYAYNIYDYEPDASTTEDITTAAGTLGSEKFDDYLTLIPRFDNGGAIPGILDEEANWPILLLFYHGLRNNPSSKIYPYASNHIYDPTVIQVAEWGLTFECIRIDGVDVGLYARQWSPMLQVLNSSEEYEVLLNIPLAQYLQLLPSDRIVISGVRMFIKQRKEQIPYRGQITLITVRTA
ncbi:hypothetical protein ACTJIJ_19835 [Niabella sp. 22666]|uniref:hypothetical protein n=1 Tax=Niabella sp. 22666 TaxID=3453954 RepID=UPI003F839B8A